MFATNGSSTLVRENYGLATYDLFYFRGLLTMVIKGSVISGTLTIVD